MSTRQDRRTVAVLLEQQGRTFASETGIRLADKPTPLYQLLVLSTLLNAPITCVGTALSSTSSRFAASRTEGGRW